MFSATNSKGYKSASIDELETTSVYEGVDRDIYKKGGVALTNDALRTHAAEDLVADGDKFSRLTLIMYCSAGASAIALGVSAGMTLYYQKALDALKVQRNLSESDLLVRIPNEYENPMQEQLLVEVKEVEENVAPQGDDILLMEQRYQARSSLCTKLAIGFGVAMIVLSIVAIYMNYRDLVDYYKVDYAPIPHYIVDEKDITTVNDKGESIVIKNLASYYKAVDCNRATDDKWYDTLDTCADLNGAGGRQWLALYTARNNAVGLILASSLKAVIGSDQVPDEYTTGIHMFGSDAAFNLNNTNYVWNNKSTSVFVYFNRGQAAAKSTTADATSAAGSVTTTGFMALAGAGGLIIGILGTLAVTYFVRKNKKKENE